MISLVPFRTVRGPLFPKPVTGQELFFAVSYSKPALTDIQIGEVSQPNILVILPVINVTAANTDPSYSSRFTARFVSFLN